MQEPWRINLKPLHAEQAKIAVGNFFKNPLGSCHLNISSTTVNYNDEGWAISAGDEIICMNENSDEIYRVQKNDLIFAVTKGIHMDELMMIFKNSDSINIER